MLTYKDFPYVKITSLDEKIIIGYCPVGFDVVLLNNYYRGLKFTPIKDNVDLPLVTRQLAINNANLDAFLKELG